MTQVYYTYYTGPNKKSSILRVPVPVLVYKVPGGTHPGTESTVGIKKIVEEVVVLSKETNPNMGLEIKNLGIVTFNNLSQKI